MDRLERAVDCSVVIANYRTDAKTCGGLERGVIVVNNGATLAAGGFRKRFPDVQLVENAGNVGFARAAKQGIGLARGQHVLCLNPDTVVHDGAVAAMVAYLEAHPSVGAVGARLLESDGTLQYSCRRFPGHAVIFHLIVNVLREMITGYRVAPESFHG